MKLTYENCDRLKLTRNGNFICGKWDVAPMPYQEKYVN